MDFTNLEPSSKTSEVDTSSSRICEQTRSWHDLLTRNGRLPVTTPPVDNLISLPHIYIGDFTYQIRNPSSDKACRTITGEIAKIFRPQGDNDGREATVIR